MNLDSEHYVVIAIALGFPNCVSEGSPDSPLKIFPSNSISKYVAIYYYKVLTVQDIIISNPLKSAGVIELEIVVLYTGGGSVNKLQTTCIYVASDT